jgi:hypothetical protein
MTLSEFEHGLNKKNRFLKIWLYTISLVLIALGFIMIYKLKISKINHPIQNSNLERFLCLIIIFTGIYFLYFFKYVRFKLKVIKNNLSKEENTRLINHIISNLLGIEEFSDTDNRQYTYKPKWWEMPFEINLYVSEGLIALNVEVQGYFNGAIIDFGASNRLRKKIVQLILNDPIFIRNNV